jgi:hypothetical protein
MTGADDGGGMHACVPHVELSCELWCSVVRPGEVRCNYISLFKEKTIIVMGLADLNRLLLLWPNSDGLVPPIATMQP